MLALAWWERGSILASDWLPSALAAGCLLLTVVVFGERVPRPARLTLAAFAGLSGFAAWTALSLLWSPVPALARDEALLLTLYAFALATPALTLRSERDRMLAVAVVVAGLGAAAVATGAVLAFGASPEEHFRGGRLYFPITYVNAQAAFSLVAVWPALALAARRDGSLAGRAVGLATAAGALAVWLLTQSAGGGVALLVSAAVVFAVARDRLRILVPAALASGLAAAAARALTEPYRARGAAVEDAVREAGTALLLVTAAAAVCGFAYALGDRRLDVSPAARRLLGRSVLALVIAGGLGGTVAFTVVEGDPRGFARERWERFSQDPEVAATNTHFASFGSERPDFWRVALASFGDHPVAGVGARGFGTVYRELGRSDENPERAHSLPLDVLSETGLVGLLLFCLAIVPLLALAVRGRRSAWGVAALGAGAYWLVHASGDWLWSVPSLGISLFLLLGIAASSDTGATRAATLRGRQRVVLGIAIAAVVLLALAPTWLSSRLTEHALRSGDASGLRLARRLDPLSTSPYLAESALALRPSEAIPPLRRALELEPRSAPLHLLLANAYEDAGRLDAALRELGVALRLHPRSDWARAQRARLEGE